MHEVTVELDSLSVVNNWRARHVHCGDHLWALERRSNSGTWTRIAYANRGRFSLVLSQQARRITDTNGIPVPVLQGFLEAVETISFGRDWI